MTPMNMDLKKKNKLIKASENIPPKEFNLDSQMNFKKINEWNSLVLEDEHKQHNHKWDNSFVSHKSLNPNNTKLFSMN